MANRKLIILFVALCLFVPSSEKSLAQIRDEYVVKAGNEELHFMQRPDIGYVVQAKKEEAAIKSLEGTLKQFKAKDVLRVGGRGRKGLSVVLEQRPAAENRNTIAALQAQSHIKYAAPLFSAGGETVAIIPEIVVRVIPGTNQAQLEALCQPLGLSIKERLEFTEIEYLIEIPGMDADNVFQAIEQLSKQDIVEWAVPNVVFRPQLLGQVIPNDEYFPNQWHLNNTGQSGGAPGADISAPAAWEITTGNPNIVVAVLDSGVDTDHPDLIDNIVPGYDFVYDDNDPNPTGNDAHGTACAGLIAGKGNNGIGITGVAWNCKIMPIKIPFGNIEVVETDIALAIRWAATNGADILSNSWGWWSDTYTSPIIHSAVIDVTEQGGIGREGKGCVVVCASGNWEGSGPVIYPAKYPEVIAVGATNDNDIVWSYSGHGPELDIVAPSGMAGLPPVGNIWTTDIVGSAGYNNRIPSILDYTDKMGGTSGACPIVAGVAALVLSVEPNLTKGDVMYTLLTTAKDLGDSGFDNYYGSGRIDANSAVKLALVTRRQWVRYGGTASSFVNSEAMAIDNSGNVYVTCGNNNDYKTIKYNQDGNTLWEATYSRSSNSFDIPYALALDNSGNVYVTGLTRINFADQEYATIKYDSNGHQLWVSRYNGSLFAPSLAIDNYGNVFVTGSTSTNGINYDYITLKYDPNGNQLWAVPLCGESIYFARDARDLAVDDSGNIYVTGEGSPNYVAIAAGVSHSLGLKSDGSINGWGIDMSDSLCVPLSDINFVAIAAGGNHNLGLNQDGSIIACGCYWNDGQCDVPEPNTDFADIAAGAAHSLGLKQNGSIVAWGANNVGQCNVPEPNMGFTAVAAGFEYSLGLKQDGSVVVWGDNSYGQCNIPAPNTDFVAVSGGGYHSLGLKQDGSIIAWGDNSSGQCDVPLPNTAFVAVSGGGSHSLGLKSDGSIVAWGDNSSGQCDVPEPNTNFKAIAAGGVHSLALNSNGFIFGWGDNSVYQAIPLHTNYVTVKYDTNGNQLWLAGYDGPGNSNDAASALAVDNSGNVYVTGKSYGNGTGSDYATIKYDSNGNQLWVARYNGFNYDDEAQAFAVDTFGNVYVTGKSSTYLTNFETATVKYDPNGNQLWVIRNGMEVKDLAVDSSSNVYITGGITKYITVKYDSNGNQKWLLLDDILGGNDCPTVIKLDTRGNIYVTGEGSNYATIKYTQRKFCMQPFDGDMDGNCKVNFSDLAALGVDWLVNFSFEDLAALANDWLECNFALEEDCW